MDTSTLSGRQHVFVIHLLYLQSQDYAQNTKLLLFTKSFFFSSLAQRRYGYTRCSSCLILRASTSFLR